MGIGERRRPVVVSAINFTEGGPLSVLRDCLTEAVACLGDRYEIVALVHRADLVGVQGVRYFEYPDSKGSWLRRLNYEYRGFRELSERLSPELWLSLHDMTPNVFALRRAVYCHNPAPFHSLTLKDAAMDPAFAMFRLFYGLLYRINIHKNDFVIVQQEWLRKQFIGRYGVSRVVVAHPAISAKAPTQSGQRQTDGKTRFLYPALPRVFKNVEIIGEAARLLESTGTADFEVLLTFGGTENRYARYIRDRFGDLKSVKFVGRQHREKVFSLYETADCLLFPSRLETWGLPITEFKPTGKPLLAADLPYAHETVGSYGNAGFFDPCSAESLATRMLDIIEGRFVPDRVDYVNPAKPFAEDWRELFKLLLDSPLAA